MDEDNIFILYEQYRTERMNKLIEMVSFFDQTGCEPHPKDVERIMELDRLIMELENVDFEGDDYI